MKFMESTRKENIFYGDIFVINQVGCLVFGHGKSKVCGSHTGPDTEQIALDMACVTKDNEKLYGHFEMDIRLSGSPDPIDEKVEIGCFIRMLSDDETKQYDTKKPVGISLDDFIDISEFNITFALPDMIPTKDHSKLTSFKELTSGKSVRCYVIPWCGTPEERGEMVMKCVTII